MTAFIIITLLVALAAACASALRWRRRYRDLLQETADEDDWSAEDRRRFGAR